MKIAKIVAVVAAAVCIASSFVSCDPVNDGQTSLPDSSSVVSAAVVDLTVDELNRFNTEFFGGEQFNMRNKFLTSEYGTTKNINLYNLFYDGVGNTYDVTEDERKQLKSALGTDELLDVIKVPVDAMNQMLNRYAGISLDDTIKLGLDGTVYLADYDAYYYNHGDSNYCEYKMKSGKRTADGKVSLRYDGDLGYEYKVTLAEFGNEYIFVSNQRVS